MTKFPKVLAAARQIEIDQWALGDALIDECGEPTEAARRRSAGGSGGDGSYAKLEECSKFLGEQGLPNYSVRYLAELRQTATDFRGRDRKTNLSWSAHVAAKEPETLKAIVAGAPEKQKVTRDYVRDVRQAAEVVEARAEREATPAHLRAPEKRPDLAAPRIEAPQVAGLQLVSEAMKLVGEIEKFRAKLGEEDLSRLADLHRDAVCEQLLAGVQALHDAEAIARTKSRKRNHLAAVGE